MPAVAYSIELVPKARDHIKTFTGRQRATVVDAMKHQLLHEPAVATRQRKPMKADMPGYVAPWELRVGELRVYYEVLEDRKVVRVLGLGIKDRNRVLFGGRETEVDPCEQ